MPDVTEANLQVVLQVIGGNDNTWGDINSANLQKLVDALTDQQTISVAGGLDVTLDDDQQRAAVMTFTGAITADINVNVNDVAEKWWFVRNNSTGNFDITLIDGADPNNVFTDSFFNPGSVGGDMGFRRSGQGDGAGRFRIR